MTKQKNTKRALFASVLSMMLCMAMLVGSTFAWFTDSVTSGKNKIVAGNLDVELEYLDAAGKWQPVTAETHLFSEFEADGTTKNLWEPGHTEIVYLKVRNAGTLALKYQLAINVAGETVFTNALGEENCKLSEHLVFGQVESDTEIAKYTSREDAWAAAGDALGLSGYAKGGVLYPEGTADKLSEQYVALVVYMPTTVGNEANYRGETAPQIELGVNLFATQTPYESDSFDEYYDEDAGYLVESAEEVITAIKLGGNIVLADDVRFESVTDGDFVVDGKSTLDLNKKTLTGSNDNIATRVKAGEVTIKNGTIVADQGTYCTVSASNGIANIEDMILYNYTAYGMSLKAFATGTINVRNTKVISETGGGATAAGGIVNIFEGCTFTQTLKFDHNSTNVSASNGGTANVYGGTFSSENYGLYVYNSGATINVYDGTFNAATAVLKADKSIYANSPSVINVYGGDFTGKFQIASGATLNIVAGTFSETGLTAEQFSQYVNEGSTLTDNGDGTFNVTSTVEPPDENEFEDPFNS